MKHQGQADKVRTKATRTTVTGPGGTKSALPSKDAIHALVATLPGTADSDYTEQKDAEEARGDMVKAIGTFTKEAVNTSAGIIYTALVDRTFEPLSNLVTAKVLNCQETTEYYFQTIFLVNRGCDTSIES